MPERSKDLSEYLDSLVPQRPPEMQAMEAYAEEREFPIVGPASGYYCYMTARLIGARHVFELASGYGYSTAWFARAVRENGGGIVYHTVWDEQLSQMARRHLDALGYTDLIRYRVSESVQALRETEGPFDLVFNDINKESYPDSLPVIAEKLRAGGVLIVDNGLWGGRVFDEENEQPSTKAIRELTDLLTSDERWITSLVPIRDGLLVAYRQE